MKNSLSDSKKLGIAARFWSKVRKGEECWEWTGATVVGYGCLTIGSRSDGTKRPEYAHRIAWMLDRGDIPYGSYICHACDNRKCVRIDHLFIGSPTDNARDMAAKDRWRNQYKDNPPTHCKRGHEFTKSNTRIGSRGERVCRSCAALWAREHRRRRDNS